MSRKLLVWAIENSDPNLLDESSRNNKFDPDLLDLLIGDDSIKLIASHGEVIRNKEKTVGEKEVSLLELEKVWSFVVSNSLPFPLLFTVQLVEPIENAKGQLIIVVSVFFFLLQMLALRQLGLWPDLINMLTLEKDSVQISAASVCGTAVQNDTQVQNDFLEYGGLPRILAMLNSTRSESVMKQAVRCISGTLQNNKKAMEEFHHLQGFKIFRSILEKNYPRIHTRILFTLHALLVQGNMGSEEFISENLIDPIIKIIASFDPSNLNGGSSLVQEGIFLLQELRNRECRFTHEQKKAIDKMLLEENKSDK